MREARPTTPPPPSATLWATIYTIYTKIFTYSLVESFSASLGGIQR